MAKIIESIQTCPFCNCKFEVEKDDIRIIRRYSWVGYYHHEIYKILNCPICGSVVKEEFLRNESCLANRV